MRKPMQRVEETIRIAAPPFAAWRLLEEPRRYPEWIHFVREVTRLSEGPVAKGTTYTERAKPGPKESLYEWTVTEWDPPRRQVHEHAGDEMEITLTIELQEAAGGTSWRHVIDYRALPKLRPVGWVLERTVMKAKMRRDLRRIVSNAKKLVEAEARSQT